MTNQLRKGDHVLISGRKAGIAEGYIAEIVNATELPELGIPDAPAAIVAEILKEDGCLETALVRYSPGAAAIEFVFAALRYADGWRDLQGQRLTIAKIP